MHNGGNTITQCFYCCHHFKKVAHESVKEVAACLWKRPCKTNSLLAGSIIFLVDACLCNNFEQWETLGDKRLKRKYKSTFKWINLCSKWFKHKPVWNCIEGPKVFFCLHKHFFGGIFLTLTLVKLLNWCFYNFQINACTSIDSTVLQALIQWLHKYRFDSCTSIDSTVLQRWIQQFHKHWPLCKHWINSHNCQMDGYIDYF